jgi:hypothetical protein
MSLLVRFVPDPDAKADHLILQDFTVLNHNGKQRCVTAMIKMIDDVRKNSKESRYLKNLGGPIYELRSKTAQGGARVYLFIHAGVACMCRAECKKEDRPDAQMLEQTAEFLLRFVKGKLTLRR